MRSPIVHCPKRTVFPEREKMMSDAEEVEYTSEDTKAESDLAGAVEEQATVDQLQEQLAHWKDMARKNEGRAKENADAARKLHEIEDAQKSDVQRLTEQLDAAQVRVKEFEVRDVRAQAARDAGLDSSWAENLRSVDAESALEEAKGIASKVEKVAQHSVTPQEPLYTQGYQGKGETPTPSIDSGRALYAERNNKN